MDDKSAVFDAIFSAAIEISSPEERAAYIRDLCGADEELRLRVQELVDAHFRAGDFLESPVAGNYLRSAEADGVTSPFVPLSEGPRSKIGRYKLLEQIGEGGFGVVFMAEQEEPIRRLVALKIIKLGMDTRQVVARFEAERQALALMDHPSVAKVLDGGATETGRPYFVMELVKGIPITEYCDKNNLSIARRLELFTQVCQAVQHAHQKGLIHRDIKPTNVLVSTQDDRPVAKVIDFGVAKAMQTRLTEKTLFTEFQQLVGTPAYMSPEQAAGGLDIDTRSDVYSLGVLLYELLAGSTPFDPKELRSKAFAELQRIIREVEPPTPSTRLSGLHDNLPTIAAQRAVEPRKLAALLRGELDWIAMKCLEKDRKRRYESAAALAADVIRYLADEPVSARPATRLYRLKKFVRRNKLPVFVSTALIGALIAGISGTTIGLVGQSRQRSIAETQRGIAETQRIEAQRQEVEAKNQAAIATSVNEFLADMLTSADPEVYGDKVTVLETINVAVKQLDAGKLKDQPLVEASVRNSIGISLRELGRLEEALRSFQRSVELYRQAVPPRPADLALNLIDLGIVLSKLNRLDEAERVLNEAVAIQREVLPAGNPDIAKSLSNLAGVMMLKGNFPEAERLWRDAIALSGEDKPGAYPFAARNKVGFAQLLEEQGRLAEAEDLLQQALKTFRTTMPSKHPLIGNCLGDLALVLQEEGKLPEADAAYVESLTIARDTLPAGHAGIAVVLVNYALLLRTADRLDEAEKKFREALEILRTALPPAHPHIANCLYNLALVLQDQKKLDDAEAAFQEALSILTKALPPGHHHTAIVRAELGTLLLNRRKLADAQSYLQQAVSEFEKAVGKSHPRTGEARMQLGKVLALQARWGDAEAELLEAERVLAVAEGGPPGIHDLSVAGLATFYSLWDKAEPGKGYDTKAKEWRAKLPEKPPVPAATQPSSKTGAPKQ